MLSLEKEEGSPRWRRKNYIGILFLKPRYSVLKIKFVGFETLGGLFLAGQVGVVPRWGRNMSSKDFTILLLRIISLFLIFTRGGGQAG